MRVAETIDRLLQEAQDVRATAEHHEEQGQLELAARHLQIEYGLHLVAHVFAATHPDEIFEIEDGEIFEIEDGDE